jgi:hypothetical protein
MFSKADIFTCYRHSLNGRPAGRNDGITMSLTPASYDWKNPDRSQKEKTFTSNRNGAQPFVAESDDRLQPKRPKATGTYFWGTIRCK